MYFVLPIIQMADATMIPPIKGRNGGYEIVVLKRLLVLWLNLLKIAAQIPNTIPPKIAYKTVEKVIVGWKSERSWHQYISNDMPVIEIHQGLHYQQFKDYFDFILEFKELQEIVNNKYKEWKLMLSATKGVYLISDTKTGKLYVGSAYGEEGIWGRWSNYVKTNGTGGNKQLKALVAGDKDYAFNFRFSILMLLPKTITPDQAIEKELLLKKKLGTNSFGLNNN